MFCVNCGKEIDDKAVICVNCGHSVPKGNTLKDASSFGLALLCFFIPILGLILYLIYEGNQPLRAKSAGRGALVGVITSVVLSIILVFFYILMIGTLVAAY